MSITLLRGDSRDLIKTLPDNSVDGCVTDPPYALDFMGKRWDTGEIVHDVAFWRDVLRVLKPGAHLLAFGGTRTYHRMACAIEDAGFEIRDQVQWLYGSGFPKSMDVSKAIDKAAGAEREVVGNTAEFSGRTLGRGISAGYHGGIVSGHCRDITAPATDAARQWDGWGTSLKPANEPICLARKPLSEGTVAANVLKWRTGALNIDGCRVEGPGVLRSTGNGKRDRTDGYGMQGGVIGGSELGRFPANVIHDGSEEVLAGFPRAKGAISNGKKAGTGYHANYGEMQQSASYGDDGSAARFFYHAKASKRDRAGSKHPTVKPVALIRYLARLIIPPGGVVLDPFAGTGTLGEAAHHEGFRAILIESEADYQSDIVNRIANLGIA